MRVATSRRACRAPSSPPRPACRLRRRSTWSCPRTSVRSPFVQFAIGRHRYVECMTNTQQTAMTHRSSDSLMTAIVQDRYGSADVLQLREIERPRPRPDEGIVRVNTAGVDFGG